MPAAGGLSVEPARSSRLACTYVLPLRRWRAEPLGDLPAYLADLVRWVDEVVVVDGSDPDIWRSHAAELPAGVRHLAVDARHACGNGKVAGVLTGLDAASHEAIVIADDDVRYDPWALRRVVDELDRAHLVRPQNVFDPLPWHARLDTARMLLNRAFGADYPGTLGVRRSALDATGGYDGDVLFENLELIRTVEAAGGLVVDALDLYVRRSPPPTRHFVGQRVRQAYDSFATPGRLAGELALLPVAALGVATRRPRLVAVGALASIALAERGRRRAGGAGVFPASSSLLAPLWLAERAVCSWVAVWRRARWGGVRYAGTTLRRAATPTRALRARHADRCPPLTPLPR